jgi:hypothetical protein
VLKWSVLLSLDMLRPANAGTQRTSKLKLWAENRQYFRCVCFSFEQILFESIIGSSEPWHEIKMFYSLRSEISVDDCVLI